MFVSTYMHLKELYSNPGYLRVYVSDGGICWEYRNRKGEKKGCNFL